MKLHLRIRLSAMMFLQYVIWGSWFVAMGKYLGEALHADANQIGAAYANAWGGAILSPFIIGLLGDRYFSAQKLLGVMHLLGAVVLFWLSQATDANQVAWLILLNSVIYMSTVALTNAIGFTHIPADQTSNTTTRIAAIVCWIVAGVVVIFVPKTWMVWALAFVLVVIAKLLTIRESKDFPTLRVWGTIGWVMVNLLIGLLEIGSTKYIFLIPAVVSVVLGLFSFILPATPPRPNADTSIAKILGLDALVLLRDRSYLTFFIGSILLCVPLSFYYGYTALYLSETGLTQVEAKMSMGQLSEIGFMILLPIFLKRWGVKNILIFGMIAWIIRYFLLKYGNIDMVWMLYGAVILHGICYDFFFVTGQIYTDQKAGGNMRGAAQGLFTIATYGIGMTLGSRLSGWIATHYSAKVGDVIQYNWGGLWMAPLIIAAVILAAFVLLFKDKKVVETE